MEGKVYRTGEGETPVLVKDVPRFEAGSKEGMEYLKENGYVVIKDVLNQEQVLEARELLWDFLESIRGEDHKTAWDRNRPDTWQGFPGYRPSGIIAGYGVGHSPLLWFIRGQPAVKKVFAQIWGTDELLTSFDGCGIFRPYKLNPLWKTEPAWYHVDQGKEKKGLHCVQGLVSLFDQTKHTGGLVVMPGTHQQHDKYMAEFGRGGDFVRVPSKHALLKSTTTLVTCKAGDLVLWDSRTFHCNTPALEDAPDDATEKKTEAEKTEKKKEEERVVTEEKATPMTDAPQEQQSGDQKEEGEKKANKEEGEGKEKVEVEEVPAWKKHPPRKWELIRAVAYVCMTPKHKADKETLKMRKQALREGTTLTHWPHEYHEGGHSGNWDKSSSKAMYANPKLTPEQAALVAF